MTDGKKPKRRKIPTLAEFDAMAEGEARQPATSGKGKAGGSTNRNSMSMREGVGRKKKVAKAPRAKPVAQPEPKPQKAETVAKQSVDKSSGTRVTSFKVRESTSQTAKKPPAPRSSGSGVIPSRTPPPPPVPPQLSEFQTLDEYARAMALYEADKRGHQMGKFKELPNDGGRDRAYESKCVKCERRAIAKVQYLEGYSDKMGQPRWHGGATKSPCSLKPRRRPTTKIIPEAKAQPDPDAGRDQDSRQDDVKLSGGITSGHRQVSHSSQAGSTRRPVKSSKSKKSEREQAWKMSVEIEIAKPSLERVLGNKARDEARHKAKEKGHRINEFILFAYPGAGGYTVYRGQCAKCQRVVLGMVKHHPEDPSKSSIVVSGDILEHRCSGVAAMPKTQPVAKRGKAKAPIRSVKFRNPLSSPVQEESAPESRKLSDRQKVYKKARMIARSDAKEKGHQMGRFDKLPDDGGRDRSYESKCVKCGGRAIGRAQFLPGFPDNMGQARAFGSATEGNCPLPR